MPHQRGRTSDWKPLQRDRSSSSRSAHASAPPGTACSDGFHAAQEVPCVPHTLEMLCHGPRTALLAHFISPQLCNYSPLSPDLEPEGETDNGRKELIK